MRGHSPQVEVFRQVLVAEEFLCVNHSIAPRALRARALTESWQLPKAKGNRPLERSDRQVNDIVLRRQHRGRDVGAVVHDENAAVRRIDGKE